MQYCPDPVRRLSVIVDNVKEAPDPSERDHRDLARRIGERCRLSGEFLLRSGEESSTYFDKYLFEADPSLLALVAEHAIRLIPKDTEILAGLELGGVPIATALSLATGIPMAFVRKEAKTYGTAQLAEGAQIAGKRVLVIEDVITTGGQVAMSTADLRSGDALVESVLCIIDRSHGSHPLLDSIGCTIISLFTEDELG
jgi:orotate phosphoribosyltransferase